MHRKFLRTVLLLTFWLCFLAPRGSIGMDPDEAWAGMLGHQCPLNPTHRFWPVYLCPICIANNSNTNCLHNTKAQKKTKGRCKAKYPCTVDDGNDASSCKGYKIAVAAQREKRQASRSESSRAPVASPVTRASNEVGPGRIPKLPKYEKNIRLTAGPVIYSQSSDRTESPYTMTTTTTSTTGRLEGGGTWTELGNGYTAISNGLGGYWTRGPDGRDID